MNFQTNIINSIENDLRALSLQSRVKKFPDFMNATERSVLRLRQLEANRVAALNDSKNIIKSSIERGSLDETKIVSPTEEDGLHSNVILRPFLLSCATKDPKLVILGLTGIQKLLSIQPIPQHFLETVVGTLRIQAETNDNKIQLKILQALLLAVSPNSLAIRENLTESTILQALGICLRLRCHKDAVIHHTASAALSQLVNLVFDRVSFQYTTILQNEGEECKTAITEEVENLPDSFRNAYFLFHDLCIIAKNDMEQKPQWLIVNSEIPMTLGVELIEEILTKHHMLLYKQAAFLKIVRNEVCSLVIKLLRSTIDFPLMLRIVRCLSVLVRKYHIRLVTECEILIVILLNMLSTNETTLWIRILILEAISNFCIDSELIYFMYIQYDGKELCANVVSSLCSSLTSSIRNITEEITEEHGKSEKVSWRLRSSDKKKGLDLLNETEPPSYEQQYGVALGVESLVNIVKVISSLSTPLLSPRLSTQLLTSPLRPKRERSVSSQDIRSYMEPPATVILEMCQKLAEVCHSSIMEGLGIMLRCDNEENDIQYLLMSFQSYTNVCGLLELSNERDALITLLCEFALPPDAEHLTDNLTMLAVKFRSEIRSPVIPSNQIKTSSLSSNASLSSNSYKLRPLLSTKNIQALKALFNIAHCLGSILEESWSKVLDTFEQLDNIIQISQRISDQIHRNKNLESKYSSLLPDPVELSIMQIALSRLFESTIHMNGEAITHVLNALGVLTVDALSSVAEKEEEIILQKESHHHNNNIVGSPIKRKEKSGVLPLGRPSGRMFALVNLIATIEHNIKRIDSEKLWDIAVAHLTLVAIHSSPVLRKFGISALTRLAQLSLSKEKEGVDNDNNNNLLPESVEQEKIEKKRDEIMQLLVLDPFLKLYTTKYSDNKLSILSGIYSIVESCGQILTIGWSTILDILILVTKEEESLCDQNNNTNHEDNAIFVGFKCVAMIMNIFLECIPFSLIEKLTLTVGCYCRQKSESNISFTAIKFLWNISDYITSNMDITLNNNNNDINILKEEKQSKEVDEIFMLICKQLKACCLDLRCEVRNSALKSLHSMLVGHGSKMQPYTCYRCFMEIDLPLLKQLLEGKTRQKEVQNELLGIRDGRDTAEKQWNETRNYAIEGTSRVMRTYMNILYSDVKFYDAWSEYLSINQVILSDPSSGIPGKTAIISLFQVLISPNVINVFMDKDNNSWSVIFPLLIKTLSNLINKIHNNKLSANIWMDSVTSVVEYIVKISSHKSLVELISFNEIKSVMDIMQSLLLLNDDDYVENAFSKAKRDRYSAADSKKMDTPLQATILRFFEIYFNSSHQVSIKLYPVVFTQLIKYLTGDRCMSELTEYLTNTSGFTIRVLPVLVNVFDHAPVLICSSHFHIILTAFSSLLHCTMRNLDVFGSLCNELVDSLMKIIKRGTDCMVELKKPYEQTENSWQSLYEIFSSFLYGYVDASSSTCRSPFQPLRSHQFFEEGFTRELSRQVEEKEAQDMILMDEENEGRILTNDVQLLFLELQIKTIQCVTNTLSSPAICNTPLSFQQLVIRLLDVGAGLRLSGFEGTPLPSPVFVANSHDEGLKKASCTVRRRISNACLEGLYSLCDCKANLRNGMHKDVVNTGNNNNNNNVVINNNTSFRDRMDSEERPPLSQFITPIKSHGKSTFQPLSIMSSPKEKDNKQQKEYEESTSSLSSSSFQFDDSSIIGCQFCNIQIASFAAPILTHHWERVLRSYIISLTNPNTKHDYEPLQPNEMVELLSVISSLETHSEIAKYMATQQRSLTTPHKIRRGSVGCITPVHTVSTPLPRDVKGVQGHILRLFPLLCDCIDSPDAEVRGQVKKLMLLSGRELGLNI